jgi:hypothetical protein
MMVTAFALVVAVISLQFLPATHTPLWWGALAATVVAGAGLLTYYLLGPTTVARDRRRREAVAHG